MNKTLRITFTILGLVTGTAVLVLVGMYLGQAGWNTAGSTSGSMMGGMMPGMPGMPGMMGSGFTNGFGSLGWPGMLLGWVVNLGLIFGTVVLVVWLVRQVSAPPTGTTVAPREILDQRYARGEITREEFELMKKDLQ